MITDVHMEPSLFDPLLGIRDVMAGLGGASRGGVYAMLAAGELKAVKLGGATKVRRSELQRFIESLPEAKFGDAAQGAASANVA